MKIKCPVCGNENYFTGLEDEETRFCSSCNEPLFKIGKEKTNNAFPGSKQIIDLQRSSAIRKFREFSNFNEILKDKNYKENIKRKQKLNNIDKLQFRTIWDEFAKVMNDEEMWDDFIKNRNQFVWDCLSEIGSTIFALFIIENRQIAKLEAKVHKSLEQEIIYAVQCGHTLNLVESLITLGNIKETKTLSINLNEFVERVFDYPRYFIHTPIEISLCEFNSQLAVKFFLEEVPDLKYELLKVIKEKIFSAALYGFAAAKIEEQGLNH